MSFTTYNLEAALLDQKVAGAFHGKTYCFTVVIAEGGWALGVAVANEKGYRPISGKTFGSETAADEWANGLNKHIGLSRDTVLEIICSTMGGRKYVKAA